MTERCCSRLAPHVVEWGDDWPDLGEGYHYLEVRPKPPEPERVPRDVSHLAPDSDERWRGLPYAG